MGNDDKTGPVGSSSEKINPYESSGLARGEATYDPDAASKSPRDFRLRFSWADRHRFLRSVGLLRLAAVIGGLVGAFTLYGTASLLAVAWQFGAPAEWWGPIDVIRTVFSVLRGGLWLYTGWLCWRLAEAIASAAGGKTVSMQTWSELQLAVVRFMVIALLVGVGWSAWQWGLMHYMLRRFESP